MVSNKSSRNSQNVDNDVSSSDSESPEEFEDQERTVISEDDENEQMENPKENPDREYYTIPELKLEPDDEVYLLQIPKTIDPKIMKGVSFSLNKKSKIRTESGKYVVKVKSASPPPILIYSDKLREIKPLSILKMEKDVKLDGKVDLQIEEKTVQTFPDIPIRHPLFGRHYESMIHLEPHVKEKLEKAKERFIKKPSRKKKMKVEVPDDDCDTFDIEHKILGGLNYIKEEIPVDSGIESRISSKKKLKDKKIGIADIPWIKDEIDDSIQIDSSRTKRGKSKSREESVELNFKVQNSSDGSESSSKKKKKRTKNESSGKEIKIKEEIISDPELEIPVGNAVTMKKIKKEIDSNDDIGMEMNGKKKRKPKSNGLELENVKGNKRKKREEEQVEEPLKKKRRKSILTSTMITDSIDSSGFGIDMSKIEFDESKIKKSYETEDEMIQRVLSKHR